MIIKNNLTAKNLNLCDYHIAEKNKII